MEKLSGKLMSIIMLQGSVDVKPESVRALFAAVEETISDALEEKNITLVTDCKTDTLPMDFDLMRAALVNLVDNARKASKSGAIISLRAYDKMIEVQDHGRGIPKKEIARITQPFYRVDRSRSKKNGGIGLGLALTQRIAEAHNAKLSITSMLGEGTTVRMIFPDGGRGRLHFVRKCIDKRLLPFRRFIQRSDFVGNRLRHSVEPLRKRSNLVMPFDMDTAFIVAVRNLNRPIFQPAHRQQGTAYKQKHQQCGSNAHSRSRKGTFHSETIDIIHRACDIANKR